MTLAAVFRLVPLPRVVRRAAGVRPTSRWRAKRAVLGGIAAAVAAQLGLSVAVETVRPQWRDPEFYRVQQRVKLAAKWQAEAGKPRPLAVILGGSRPQMGLAPEAFGLGGHPADPVVFNGSQAGALPVGIKLNLARVLDSNVRPDFVLIEVMPALLADPGPMEDRIPSVRLGLADVRRVRPYHDDPDRAMTRWVGHRLAPWHSLRQTLVETAGLADELVPEHRRQDLLWKGRTFSGWGPFSPAEWPDDVRRDWLNRVHKQYRKELKNLHVAAVNDRIYRDALADCRTRGVRAALFVMPESPVYRGWYAPGGRERVAAYLADLSREFGVPVFDASAWIDDEAAFMDGHHVLGPAAVELSVRFGRECVAPWVRSFPPPPPR